MEKQFSQDVPHSLGREEAKRRMDEGLPKLLAMLPGGRVQHRWTGDTMFLEVSALGQDVDAAMEVLDDRVHLDVRMRGLLAAMGDKIAGLFRRGTAEMLEDKRGR